MPNWRSTFDAIETAAARGDLRAKADSAWIDSVIQSAFTAMNESPQKLKLAGDDRCERVAEALAVWIKESDKARFESLCGAAYAVSGLDDSADGMERLRDADQFILLAYPSEQSSVASLADEWASDLDSCARPDGFGFRLAESVVRQWAADNAAYLESKLAESASYLRGETREESDCGEPQFVTFRLYVTDSSVESDQ